MEYGIIYLLSFPNGKYIGQTIQGIKIRMKEHLRDTRKGSKLPVHNALRKYTDLVNIQVIDKAYSLEELNELEKQYIIEYNTFNNNGKNENGYNLTIGGDGCKSYKFTEEQKENCRKIQSERKFLHPEIAKNHSKYMKERAIQYPEIGQKHSHTLKDLYSNNPEKKENMSKIKIKQYKDNPDMARQQCELKLMFYEDKRANQTIDTIRENTKKQWNDPDQKKKIMDEKRKRFSKLFSVYKDGIYIRDFDYVPDCSNELFGINSGDAGNISAVLKGKRKLCRGYFFKYKTD
jgi:hypothetical protein